MRREKERLAYLRAARRMRRKDEAVRDARGNVARAQMQIAAVAKQTSRYTTDRM